MRSPGIRFAATAAILLALPVLGGCGVLDIASDNRPVPATPSMVGPLPRIEHSHQGAHSGNWNRRGQRTRCTPGAPRGVQGTDNNPAALIVALLSVVAQSFDDDKNVSTCEDGVPVPQSHERSRFTRPGP